MKRGVTKIITTIVLAGVLLSQASCSNMVPGAKELKDCPVLWTDSPGIISDPAD